MLFTKDTHIEHSIEKAIELQAAREVESAALGLEKLDIITQNTVNRECATSSTIWKKCLSKIVPHIVEEANKAFKPHRKLMKQVDCKYIKRLKPEIIILTAMDGALNRLALNVEATRDSISNYIRHIFIKLIVHDILKGTPKMKAMNEAAIYNNTMVDKKLKGLLACSQDVNDLTNRDLELLSRISALSVSILVSSGLLIMELKGSNNKGHSKNYLHISPDFMSMLKDDSLLDMTSYNIPKPMLVIPRDWSFYETGGYITEQVRPIPFVSNESRVNAKEIQKRCSEEFFIALNAAQRTPFRINLKVAELLEAAQHVNNIPNIIPDMDDPERLHYTKEEIADPESEDAKSKRLLMRHWYVNCSQLRQKRLAYFRTVKDIKENINHARFYFPHKLDFRGRLYPVAGGISPQGASLSKSCLEFADGVPWGEHGQRHTEIAIADAAGEKGTEEELIAWTQRNYEMIKTVVGNIEDYVQHIDGFDNPFAFVALGDEYIRGRDNPEFISHVPVYKDGSVNGLQHIFAIMGDEVGAQHVNLNSGDTKGDAYEVVSEALTASLRDYLDKGIEREATREIVAKILSIGLTRKDVKSIVMTIPYGSTRQGNLDTLTARFIERFEEVNFSYKKSLGITYYTFLRSMVPIVDLLGEVTRELLPSASIFQEYMRECARLTNLKNEPIVWQTDTMFTVHANKKALEKHSKTLKVRYSKLQHYISIKGVSNKLDRRKQVSGIVANFIHSIDACCLMLTVARLRIHYDIQHFALIHDAMGTHAGRCDEMQEVIRDVFVEVHEDKPLEKFKATVEETAGVELPDLPERGSLDLNEVRKSTYFFS